jgi:PAS domain S-box-containing protein
VTPLISDDPVDLLLVDDRPEDLLTLTHVLASPEYRLQTASSGPEALKRLLEQDFGVILLDVFMPTMDGFELAELIKQRERCQHTPIIFLTAAVSDMPQIYRGYSVGAVDYLTKPVDPDVVRAKVAVFADLFRKDRRLERHAQALREGERREREVMLTELRHAAERRYMNLAEAVPLSVWTAGPSGELTYANRYWTEYTGISLGDARGFGWARAVHDADREGYLQAWRACIERGASFQQECRIQRQADGAFRWHLSRAVPERSDEGQIVSWLGTYTDIEESKQAVFARDEFLSIASHELRTPLTALKLRLQSVLHSRDLSEKTERRVDSAVRQTERLERLIDNLLDVSRPRGLRPGGAGAGRLRALPRAGRRRRRSFVVRGARVGARPLGSHAGRTGLDEPARQRLEVRRRQTDLRERDGGRAQCRSDGGRPGNRHCPRRPEPHFSSVRTRARTPHLRRSRNGAVHCPSDRAGAWWPHRGR